MLCKLCALADAVCFGCWYGPVLLQRNALQQLWAATATNAAAGAAAASDAAVDALLLLMMLPLPRQKKQRGSAPQSLTSELMPSSSEGTGNADLFRGSLGAPLTADGLTIRYESVGCTGGPRSRRSSSDATAPLLVLLLHAAISLVINDLHVVLVVTLRPVGLHFVVIRGQLCNL